jgi:DNA topoisomerase-1
MAESKTNKQAASRTGAAVKIGATSATASRGRSSGPGGRGTTGVSKQAARSRGAARKTAAAARAKTAPSRNGAAGGVRRVTAGRARRGQAAGALTGAGTPGGKNLVIVESPTKARTLAGFLGRGYDVRASVGHVRDLPKSKLGVDVAHGFAPQYEVPKEKADVIRQLKSAAKNAEVIYLATDPDREGEAISWHLVEAMGLKNRPMHRVEFHEITRDAIHEAFQHPRELDRHLIDAQQARRVLDRLVGYKISPLLWKKVRRGLSAGRVQSVALRMIVEREREIQNFQAREYWSIDAELLKEVFPDQPFRARLLGYATDRKRELEIPNEQTAEQLRTLLQQASFTVAEVRQRTQNRRPAPPFTTSTLQQEASRRLGFSAKRTMTVAQQLYEGREVSGEGQVGLITYMRTDSTNVSTQAVAATRALIAARYGHDFVPSAPRIFSKRAKGAQEAHEAIRPTDVSREPERIRRFLTPDQQKLYTLIWQRMVASQMADAVLDVTSVDIEARPQTGGGPGGEAPVVGGPVAESSGGSAVPTGLDNAPKSNDIFLFRASASRMRFPGFRAVYVEARDDDQDEDADTRALPDLEAGDPLKLLDLIPEQHFTEPPPRYTEASLVKALEENGIGRPSTYAPTISTLQDREYVEKVGRQLRPQELGFTVTDMLTEHFSNFVDIGFTAEMEEELDEIASGERRWQPVIEQYYGPLVAAVTKASDAPVVLEQTDERCHECEAPMVIRWGRFGKFLACSRYPECKGSRPLGHQEEQQAATDEKCPECGGGMIVKTGRFGRFLACARYPSCKGSKKFLTKIGIDCPDCGGSIVQRRSRGRGKTFYGCSNFPTCNFTSWTRPQPEPCPSCGYVVAQEGQNGVKCLRCPWRGEREPAEATA